eukprot:3221318-Amphidinium_carterae.1
MLTVAWSGPSGMSIYPHANESSPSRFPSLGWVSCAPLEKPFSGWRDYSWGLFMCPIAEILARVRDFDRVDLCVHVATMVQTGRATHFLVLVWSPLLKTELQ